MKLEVRKVECYRFVVEDQIAEAAKTLNVIADAGVDFLAFKAVPAEPNHTRFTLIPTDGPKIAAAAEKAGLKLDGPSPAVLIIGDEKPGALAEIYGRLSLAGIHVTESSGMAHIRGGYGVLLHLSPDACEDAMKALVREDAV